MDFIKGNEQVRIDPSGIDISGAGHIFMDSNSVTGDISFNDKVTITNVLDVNGDLNMVGELNMVGDLSMNGDIEVNNGTIGIGKTASSGILLDVSGNINFNGDLYKNGSLLSLDGNQATAVISRGMAVQIRHTDYNKKVRKLIGDYNEAILHQPRGFQPIDRRENGEGFVVKITPRSVNSKVLISTVVHISGEYTADARWWGVKLYRKKGAGGWEEVEGANGTSSTDVLEFNFYTDPVNGDMSVTTPFTTAGTAVWFANNQGVVSGNNGHQEDDLIGNSTASYLDSPGTTEEVIYTLYWGSKLSETTNGYRALSLNKSWDQSTNDRASTSSSLTATEIWDDSIPYNPTSLAIQVDENTNNVGIGTSLPNEKLEISDGNILLTGVTNYSYGQDTPLIPETPLSIKFKKDTDCQYSGYYGGIVAKISAVYDNQDFSSGSNALAFYTYTGRQSTADNTVERMRISGSGFVGIGKTNPEFPLDIAGTTSGPSLINVQGTKILHSIGVEDNHAHYDAETSISIRTEMSGYFRRVYVPSDSRIKTDISLVNDDTALKLVNALESKEYHYIDPRRKRPMKTIGFIAQEVKDVVPNAITLQKEFIPDEMRIITQPTWTEDGGKYYLNIPDLDMSGSFTGKGKFYVSNDPSGNDEVCKEVDIKEVPTSSMNEFSTTPYVAEFDESWNNVFFYGKEVSDFHTLDKAQIFALHHSAIQELDRKHEREITEKNNKIQTLEGEVSNLTGQVSTLTSRLEALEASVLSLQNN